MKRILSSVALVAVLLFLLVSCTSEPNAYTALSEFISAYGASGIIYSPQLAEDEDGYIDGELFGRIFVTNESPPENYALFLNSHADYGSECGIFVTSDAVERERIAEMCEERVRLLDPAGESRVILRHGSVIFYSTMSERERVTDIFLDVLR